MEKLTKKVKDIKVGHGFMDGITQGPMITESGLQKADQHLKDAVSKGAEITIGGQRKELEYKGNYYEPTVIRNVSSDSIIGSEETFGPVAPIFTFEDDDEVVNMANNSDYGLASYFYSDNLNRALNVSNKLEYGMVGVNSGLISSEIAPFGGVKFSGIGREGSVWGIDEYINLKYTCIDNVD